MDHTKALELLHIITDAAPRPVSVFVADDHGELVAAVTMRDAAADTRLNAQRKAYTAARGDVFTSRELGARAAATPRFLHSHDAFFTFFGGGVAMFVDGRRVGAVGVSGLSEEE